MFCQQALLASEVSLFDANSWFYAVAKGVYWIIDAMEHAYGYLTGLEPITDNGNVDTGGVEEVGDILLKNITDNRIQQIFLYFFIFAAGLLLVAIAVGMIKASFTNDDQLASRRKVLEKALSAFMIMILLPIIIFIAVIATGAFFRFIQGVMQESLGVESGGIAQSLHKACLPKGFDKAVEFIIKDNGEWLSYNELKTKGAADGYQYFLGIIVGGILIYVLIAICTSLVERLIEVVFFYLIGPFVLARSPLDDGGSFKLWKDIIIAKLLSAGGVILCMYLYFLLLSNINVWFTPGPDETTGVYVAKSLVRIFFMIGGAFAVKKGALSIAQVISSNTGISEGMSQGQSMQLLSSGLRTGMSLAKGAIGGAMMGARTMLAGGGGGAQGALSSITSNSGGAGITPTAGGDVLGGGAQAMSSNSGGGAAAMPSAIPGGDAIAAAANLGGGNAFMNPYDNGARGKLARAGMSSGGGGGARQAFMYGGVSALAGAGLFKLATLPFKGVAKLAKGLYNHPESVAAREARKNLRDEKRNEAVRKNPDKYIDKLGKLEAKNNKTAQQINARYTSQGGYTAEMRNNLTAYQNSGRQRKIQEMLNKLGAAGVSNETISNRLNLNNNNSGSSGNNG